MSKGIGVTMADDRRTNPNAPAAKAVGDVRGLAREAIMVLASGHVPRAALSPERVQEICDAFLSDDNEARHAALAELRADGHSVPDLIDNVIPDAARLLGQHWADDTLSFAEVSIGSARLQEAVRALVSRDHVWDMPEANNIASDTGRAARVLMVIPQPEDHTLGTFVASDQLRRFGYAVDIAVDKRPQDLAMILRQRRFCMVGISVAGRRTLASARELVDIIRTTVTGVTPVVLGGSLLDTEVDLKRMTGVDHVAVSVRDALEKCGLNVAGADLPQDKMLSHED